MQYKLLSRDEFRESTFKRDSYKCLICSKPAVDAHHIIERKLWTDGGYYLNNGASLCSEHHIEAEETKISCEKLRELAKIKDFPLPEHLSHSEKYDKWGNQILPNGTRLKGELFTDVSVQKILTPVLSLFVDKVKYPRTFHLPWSPGVSSDDKVLESTDVFIGKQVVVTVKMDGENTTMYNDYIHARSLDSDNHPSRSMVKQIHAGVCMDIPIGWRVCGENLFAVHSIKYSKLEDYFLVFSIWNDKNECLDWTSTVMWSELLGLKTVPVLYTGLYDEKLIKGLYKEFINDDPCEGYVVRLHDSFTYRQFRTSVAKYVRSCHVTTDQHWKTKEIERNILK